MSRITKKLLKICFGTVLVLGFASIATAGMYKWTDKDGNVHYSQQPPSEGNYETMHVDTQSPDGSETGSASQSSPSYGSPNAASTNSTGGSNGSNALQQTEAKANAQRQANCAQAKKALETYTVYRRLRDKNGNVTRLSDTERAKRIEQAKSAIQEFCQ